MAVMNWLICCSTSVRAGPFSSVVSACVVASWCCQQVEPVSHHHGLGEQGAGAGADARWALGRGGVVVIGQALGHLLVVVCLLEVR
jgi:hypothetical protein